MELNINKYNVKRFDLSSDKSLIAWSAADEHLLQYFHGLESKPDQVSIYHDRFGFLSSHLHDFSPTLITTEKSQENAISKNLEANSLPILPFSSALTPLEEKAQLALMKIPKSLGLFRFFLEHISRNSSEAITVVCSFMTRHFSPKVLKIAEQYFEVVEQSKAVKKSRLIILKGRKNSIERKLTTTSEFNGQAYQQYLGVFSADHIDYATQFLIKHLDLSGNDKKILDLGSGNGVIGSEIAKQLPEAQISLVDDSYLAVASAELNISGENIHHHCENDLTNFEEDSLDLIVTNPPFHFEHEINVQVPLALFKSCYKCLKKGGTLQMVANQHLNYKVHLNTYFSTVEEVATDKKYVVYKCTK